jgi:CHAT domain-containing protein
MKARGRLFDAVDLLTLSACNTAAQRADSDGREIDGFAELAQRLGASAVMATLWPVSDNSTPRLMSNFYRLRQSGVGTTKAEALRRAQLSLLDGTSQGAPVEESDAMKGASEPDVQIVTTPPGGARVDDDPRRDTGETVYVEDRDARPYTKNPARPYSHPYYWAPFVLFGNWQ